MSRQANGPVVLIDDEPYVLRSLSYLRTREGYTVETASDGDEGLELVCRLRPALVILDIVMPSMTGYEVCDRIRQDPALAGTYVIILSARDLKIDRERGLLGGADEYLTKPFSPCEVAKRIRGVFDGFV